MKRSFTLLLILFTLFASVSCSGSYAKTELVDPVALPDDGIIGKELLSKIKSNNSIATFKGSSGGLDFEWKIFGSDIKDARDVDLSLSLKKADGGIKVTFSEREAFGFKALLSIHLDEKWTEPSAGAYRDGEKICSVSITGSKTSILNLSVDEYIGECTILPVKEEQSAANDTSRPSSDGSRDEQDKYLTDPIPEGKPLPVEPEDQVIDREKAYTCTISIECSAILNNLKELDPDKLELVPSDGIILPPVSVIFYEGESVFDVLKRVCTESGIHLEFSWTPVYNSAYIEGIHNLYEFDCGELSGWMFRVDGWYPNYGCSRYRLADGEVIEWRYTCDLGKDIGCDWMARS